MTNVLKWAAYVDGMAMAAAVYLGNAYPPAKPWCDGIAEIGGALTSFLAVVAHVVPAKAS